MTTPAIPRSKLAWGCLGVAAFCAVILLGFILMPRPLLEKALDTVVTDALSEGHPFRSSNEAAMNHALIARVTAAPDQFIWRGHSVKVKDAWIAHKVKRNHYFFTAAYRPVPGYQLCVALEGMESSDDYHDLLFVQPGHGSGFGGNSGEVWENLDTSSPGEISVEVRDSWHGSPITTITFSPASNAPPPPK